MTEFVILTELFPYAHRPELSNCNESEFVSVYQVTSENVEEATKQFIKKAGAGILTSAPKRVHHLYEKSGNAMKLIKMFSLRTSLEEVLVPN